MKYIIAAMLWGLSIAGMLSWLCFIIVIIDAAISPTVELKQDTPGIDICILGMVSMIGLLYSTEIKNKIKKD